MRVTTASIAAFTDQSGITFRRIEVEQAKGCRIARLSPANMPTLNSIGLPPKYAII
jgi:hypothetical protein